MLKELIAKRPELLDIRDIDAKSRLCVTVDQLIDPALEYILDSDDKLREEFELAFGILCKKPEQGNFEGRGCYYDLSSFGSPGRFCYVKGSGSIMSFDSTDSPINPIMFKYPGFGSSRENIFFDELFARIAEHPRTLGAETLRWAGLEMITATLIFESLVQKYDITSLEQARKLGLTIPLSVTKFDELGYAIKDSIETLITEQTSKNAIQSMSWRGNFEGIGCVALEVPSNKRFVSANNLDEMSEEQLKPYFNPENYTIVARTLKELLSLGVVYSINSSHLQNIYFIPSLSGVRADNSTCLCAQADNSDLLYLGSITELKPSANSEFWLKNTISIKDQQIYLIKQQLTGRFTPSFGLSEEFMRYRNSRDEINVTFLSELLGDKIDQTRIRTLTNLLPMFDDEIKTSIAYLLHKKYCGDTWDQIANKHDCLLDTFDGVNLREEYEKRKQTLLGIGLAQFQEVNIIQQKTLDSFLSYIETGHRKHLDAIPALKEFELFKKSLVVFDENIQEELLSNLFEITDFISEELCADWNKSGQYWFENRADLLKEATKQIRDEPEVGLTFVRNLYRLFTNLGDSLQDWTVDDAFVGVNYKTALGFIRPEEYGLREGLKRQQFLINIEHFFFCILICTFHKMQLKKQIKV